MSHKSRDVEYEDEFPVFLMIGEVARRTGLSESTIRRLYARDEFPAPVQISERRIGWIESEIVGWQSELMAARSR